MITDGASNNLIGGTGTASKPRGYPNKRLTDRPAGNSGQGAANSIAFNGGSGVRIADSSESRSSAAGNRPNGTPGSPVGNQVLSNHIFGNTGLGIDIGSSGVSFNDPDDPDEGPNRGQNYPEVTNLQIDGNGDLTFDYNVPTNPDNANYGSIGLYIEFYISDSSGQGQMFIGSDQWTVDDYDNGGKSLNLGNAADLGFTPDDYLTSTATDADGNSSEFFPVSIQTPTPTPSPTCPDVTTPVMTSKTGDSGVPVMIPVNSSDLTGLDVISADITFNYDPAVLSSLPADISVTSGSTSPGAEVNYNTTTAGTIVISVFNAVGFTGAGSVVDLNMKVIGPIGSGSPLTLASFSYNGGLVCSNVTSGSLTVVSGTVTGRVSFENEPYPSPTVSPTPTPLPVPGTRLNAVGGSSFFQLSDPNGNYSLGGFGPGAYTVTPSRPDEDYMAANGIFSNDPSLVAQYVVGLATLNSVQQRAADVSGLHSLSSFDAALIAQWTVGITNPINQTGQWKFTPVSTTPDTTVDNVQNYTALLMGDVNGDWMPPLMRPDVSIIPDTRNAVRVSVPGTKAAQGSLVTIPLTLSDLRGRGVGSYQFDIEYDPAVISPAAIAADVSGTICDGFGVFSHSPSPGLLKVVVYGTIPVTTDGIFVNLRFSTIGVVDATTPLTIRGFRLNDARIGVVTTNGKLRVTASTYVPTDGQP